MKTNKHTIRIAALSTVFALGIGLIVNAVMPRTEVDASNYSVRSVPTNIDLNDASESTIRSYYASLNSLSSNERKGTNLLKNLKPILKKDQKYLSYGSSATTAVWKAYEIVDRDWVKSPASAISGYNAQTNTITGYAYGTSNSNVGTNPYIHALYVNRDVDNQTRAWGNHNQNQWGINQEHVWAKSCGFQDESPAAGARGDLMHLWAGNGRVNGDTHSNYYYGYVDRTKTYNNAGSYASTLSGNLRGNSKTLGGSVTVFEPQDSDKGDIARAIFYMAARYNYLSGSDSDGIDAGNPNLEIVNNVTSWQNSGYQSTTTTTGKMGVLQDLLEWNRLDPPDEFEIHRNNLLYNNFTNNRNPFIDFPSWANAIWGTVDANGNYNPTVTTYASPASDPLNTEAGDVFGISARSINMHIGETTEISGNNATGDITWSVEDDSVVSIDKTSTANNEAVTITALDNGTTTITATNGSDSITCSVAVTEATSIYGTINSPLNITEATNIIENMTDSVTEEKMYVKGIVSSNTGLNTKYSNQDSIWLQSDDGQTAHGLELYHVFIDSNVTYDCDAAGSMIGKEVVAYGYGKKYNDGYELAPVNNTENPIVLSVEDPYVPVKTPAELVEEQTTTTTLAYHYEKEDGVESSIDTLTRATTGITSTTYDSWTSTGTSGIEYAGQSAGGNESIQLRTNNNNSGIVVNSNPNGICAISITVTWNTNTDNARSLDFYGKDTAYTDPSDLYGDDKGASLGSLAYANRDSNNKSILTINGNYEFIGLKSHSGALWIESLDIEWGGSAATYTYSNVSIRFGGLLTQELWNDLDTENHIIEGFGVMITTEGVVDDDMLISDFYDSAALAEENPDIENEIVDYYMSKQEMATPVVSGDNYIWNLFFRINNLATKYVAVAYIKTTEGYVFMEQVRYSAKTLAQDYLANRGCNSATAGGSLSNLANL